jgi:lysophospholipid acyltransferase (LPLAT)-like uncharacterized protein
MPEKQPIYAPSLKAERARTTGYEVSSKRRMSRGRRVWYSIVVALSKLTARFIWLTCRVDKVIGQEHLDRLVAEGRPVIACYWHQMHLYCAKLMLDQIPRGLKVGFLISPSVSGEVPTAIATSWGANVLRGSPTRTGGQALRDMYQAVRKEGISPVITVDGPKGPLHEFKVGAVLLARLTKAPMLPMAFAASKAKHWDSWDQFILPRPFSRIVIAIGAPETVPPETPIEELEPIRQAMEQGLKALTDLAQSSL